MRPDFKKMQNMIPAIVQDVNTKQVLMLAYVNEEAYDMMLKTHETYFYSRSRQELWHKGETSGHLQYIKSMYLDCDADTLLIEVEQVGVACHTGTYTCFSGRKLVEEKEKSLALVEPEPETSLATVLNDLYNVIQERQLNPVEGSYTNYLFDKGMDKMLKKLGEENTEIIIAAKNPGENEIIYEIADYLYHLEVVMAEKGVDWDDVSRELVRRQKKG